MIKPMKPIKVGWTRTVLEYGIGIGFCPRRVFFDIHIDLLVGYITIRFYRRPKKDEIENV